MFIRFLFVVAFLKFSHGYFGITRSSLYEENESTWIAWTNEEIPSNLQQFFKFDGTTLLVIPPDGLSIEFVIARPENKNDTFIAEWCAPAKEEYDKCDYDISFVSNTVSEIHFSRSRIGRKELTSMAFVRFNGTTVFIKSMQYINEEKWTKVLSNPLMCYRWAVENSGKFHAVECFIGNKWIKCESTISITVGGVKYSPLLRHSGYQQSGRMLNGKFCDIPFRFPNSGIVFQKGIRRIRNIFEVLEGPPSQILLHQPESNFTVPAIAPATTTILPPSLSINYLIAIIFGGICVGIMCIAFICLIGTLLIRKKRKETFDGRPSFSLEPINNNDDVSVITNPPEIQSIDAPSSSKQSISKNESVQNDCGYSKLIKSDFENNGQMLLPLQNFDNKNQSIIQFLIQEFESSSPIKGPKSVDELLQEALEESMAENRAEKLLQVVVKANNELYSLGYRNKQLGDSSKFHLTIPPKSDALLKNLKGRNFLKFIISVCKKDIDGKNGEFEDDPKRWKKYVEEVDVGECFRHACLFGQTMKRRQFFIMATFYKVSLLIAENPNRNDLLSMKYPIPFFIILCEKYPHYFEIH